MAKHDLNYMEQTVAQYAVEHITVKGLHTGEIWLRDAFSEYCTEINAYDYGRRHIVAQKVVIDCIHALNNDQLHRLDLILDDIARDPVQARSVKR